MLVKKKEVRLCAGEVTCVITLVATKRLVPCGDHNFGHALPAETFFHGVLPRLQRLLGAERLQIVPEYCAEDEFGGIHRERVFAMIDDVVHRPPGTASITVDEQRPVESEDRPFDFTGSNNSSRANKGTHGSPVGRAQEAHQVRALARGKEHERVHSRCVIYRCEEIPQVLPWNEFT